MRGDSASSITKDLIWKHEWRTDGPDFSINDTIMGDDWLSRHPSKRINDTFMRDDWLLTHPSKHYFRKWQWRSWPIKSTHPSPTFFCVGNQVDLQEWTGDNRGHQSYSTLENDAGTWDNTHDMSDVSLTSIPIDWLDLVTNTIVGTTIKCDKIRIVSRGGLTQTRERFNSDHLPFRGW